MEPLRRWPAALALMALLALCLGGTSPYFEGFSNANERPRLLQGMALVDGDGWGIDGPAARGLGPGIDVAQGDDGGLYPNKPPGATVPAAFAWAVLTAFDGDGTVSLRTYTLTARLFGALLPTLLLCWLLLLECRRVAGEKPALAAVSIFALATPCFSQAHLLFGHALAACLGFWGVALILRADAPRRAAIGGFIAACAVTVEYAAAFAALPLLVHLAGNLRTRRAVVLATVAGGLVPVLALAAYHNAVFGSPLSTGYHHTLRPAFSEVHAQGLLGLSWPSANAAYEHLLSPWGGLLLFAPALAWGIAYFRRRDEGQRDQLVRIGTATFVVVLVVNLCLIQTGGWRVGPRYSYAASAFVVPLLALALRGASPRAFAGLLALVCASGCLNFLAANQWPHLIPEGNPLTDQLLPLWGRDVYGAARTLGVTQAGVVLAPFVTLAIVWPLAALRREQAKAQAWVWPVGVGTGLLALCAVAFAFAPSPDAAANLGAIDSVWEPSGEYDAPSRALAVESAPGE